MQHTHHIARPSAPLAETSETLSLLSFNAWHNMPPAYLYPDPTKRWEKYWLRFAHLANVILDSEADIVGLQEMRYDETFGPPGYHSQIEHLLDLLSSSTAASSSKGSRQQPYQYVYQPAMAFHHDNTFHREEEGVALLSKYPVISTEYMLLPRDYTDKQDGHQRICLYAEIDKPGFG